MKVQLLLPARLKPSAERMRSGMLAFAARLLLLLLPFILLLPGIAGFPYPSPAAQYSDLAITHYPNAVYLRQSLLAYRSIPLWSPTILSGYPFAANPLSGLYYPFGWLALLVPLPLGFNLLVGLHLIWGGLGFYWLLRKAGLQEPAALLGALAFGGMPKLFAHYGAGHITLIYAVSWTPWLLLFSERPSEQVGEAHWRDRLVQLLPGVILALIFMADVRWAAYAALLWWAYCLWRWWGQRRISGHAALPVGQNAPALSLTRQVWRLALLSALALTLAAPLALPLVEYTALSTRSLLAQADVMAYSLPPARLLGMFFPDLEGFHEWILYPGWVVLWLGLLAVVSRLGRSAFWLWVAVGSLIFALGEHLPGLPALSRLPLFDLLRVPPRSLFLFGIALAWLAAEGLQALLQGIPALHARRLRLLFVFLTGLCAALAGVVALTQGSLPVNMLWGLAALASGAAWIWLGVEQRMRPQWTLLGLFVLCALDLGGVNRSLFAPRPADQVLSQASGTVGYLASRPGVYRVYSPSYSLPQQSAVTAGIQLADGVDPLQLKGYAGFMQAASGVPNPAYSVTLPPFHSGDPATANLGFLPDPQLLGLLNVRYVASEFDINLPDLALRDISGSTRLYENRQYMPRAWVQPNEGAFAVNAPVEALHWQPNQIQIRASGPGMLVLSEIQYPGWQVWVDGARQEMQTAASILRAVRLPTGDHQVVFRFRPVSLYAGLGLAVLGLVGLLLWCVLPLRRLSNG